MFLGFAVVYGLRVNLSVAMVAMVNTTDPKPAPNSSVFHACPLPPGMENTSDTFPQPDGVTVLLSIFPFVNSQKYYSFISKIFDKTPSIR